MTDTDEERQKLVARLRAHEVFMWTDIDLAADEIERLAAEVEEWKQAAEVSIDEDAVDAAFEQWMKTREPRYMGLQRGAFHAGVEFGLRHAQSNAEPKPDDWLYSASECAREVLNYLGEGSVASMEPGMDRRRDNVAKIINRYLDKPPALAQSDAEPDPNFDPVEAAEVDAKSIEAANAQSDAEPVAWRYRWRVNAGVEWTKWREINEIGAKYYAGLPDHEVQSLLHRPTSEPLMTDEERQKLVADLREFTGLDNEPWLVRVGRDAANEIERLADRVNALEHIINLDMYEATKNALVQAQDEIERLRDMRTER